MNIQDGDNVYPDGMSGDEVSSPMSDGPWSPYSLVSNQSADDDKIENWKAAGRAVRQMLSQVNTSQLGDIHESQEGSVTDSEIHQECGNNRSTQQLDVDDKSPEMFFPGLSSYSTSDAMNEMLEQFKATQNVSQEEKHESNEVFTSALNDCFNISDNIQVDTSQTSIIDYPGTSKYGSNVGIYSNVPAEMSRINDTPNNQYSFDCGLTLSSPILTTEEDEPCDLEKSHTLLEASFNDIQMNAVQDKSEEIDSTEALYANSNHYHSNNVQYFYGLRPNRSESYPQFLSENIPHDSHMNYSHKENGKTDTFPSNRKQHQNKPCVTQNNILMHYGEDTKKLSDNDIKTQWQELKDKIARLTGKVTTETNKPSRSGDNICACSENTEQFMSQGKQNNSDDIKMKCTDKYTRKVYSTSDSDNDESDHNTLKGTKRYSQTRKKCCKMRHKVESNCAIKNKGTNCTCSENKLTSNIMLHEDSDNLKGQFSDETISPKSVIDLTNCKFIDIQEGTFSNKEQSELKGPTDSVLIKSNNDEHDKLQKLLLNTFNDGIEYNFCDKQSNSENTANSKSITNGDCSSVVKDVLLKPLLCGNGGKLDNSTKNRKLQCLTSPDVNSGATAVVSSPLGNKYYSCCQHNPCNGEHTLENDLEAADSSNMLTCLKCRVNVLIDSNTERLNNLKTISHKQIAFKSQDSYEQETTKCDNSINTLDFPSHSVNQAENFHQHTKDSSSIPYMCCHQSKTIEAGKVNEGQKVPFGVCDLDIPKLCDTSDEDSVHADREDNTEPDSMPELISSSSEEEESETESVQKTKCALSVSLNDEVQAESCESAMSDICEDFLDLHLSTNVVSDDEEEAAITISPRDIDSLPDLRFSSEDSESGSEADDEFECDCAVCVTNSQEEEAFPSLHASSIFSGNLEDEEDHTDPETETNNFFNETLSENHTEFEMWPFLPFSIRLSELSPIDLLITRQSRRDLLEMMFQNVFIQMLAVYPELLSDRAPPPLNPEDVANIPVINIDESQLAKETKCPICLCEFDEGEEARQLQCKHTFHTLCIEAWFAKSGTCPVCRDVIKMESTS